MYKIFKKYFKFLIPLLLLILIIILFYKSSNYENFDDNSIIPNDNDSICLWSISKKPSKVKDNPQTWSYNGKCMPIPAHSFYTIKGSNGSADIISPTLQQLLDTYKTQNTQNIKLNCLQGNKWNSTTSRCEPTVCTNGYHVDNGNCVKNNNIINDNELCTNDIECKSGSCMNKAKTGYNSSLMQGRCLYSKGNYVGKDCTPERCASGNTKGISCTCL